MPVSAYNTNPALNTSISGIDIAENAAAAGFNNALRQIMADIKTWTDALTPVSTPISIANGGTGSTTAAAALAALGALPAAGGTVSGNITRSSKGIHPYFASTSMTGGTIYVQASGSDPTANPGDIVLEY